MANNTGLLIAGGVVAYLLLSKKSVAPATRQAAYVPPQAYGDPSTLSQSTSVSQDVANYVLAASSLANTAGNLAASFGSGGGGGGGSYDSSGATTTDPSAGDSNVSGDYGTTL
jgi:hypothetical protein